MYICIFYGEDMSVSHVYFHICFSLFQPNVFSDCLIPVKLQAESAIQI